MEVRAEQEVCIAADVFRHSVCEKKLLNVASVRLMTQENARVYFSQIHIMQLCNIIHFHYIGMFLFLFSTVAKRVVSMQSQSRAPFSLSIPPCSPAALQPCSSQARICLLLSILFLPGFADGNSNIPFCSAFLGEFFFS